MALIDRIPPAEVEVPHEPGNFMTVRALSGDDIDAIRTTENAAAFGDLVRLGVTAWRGPNYDGVACDDAAKKKLDDRTREWAAGQVWEISHPNPGEAPSSENGSAAGDADTPDSPAASSERSAGAS